MSRLPVISAGELIKVLGQQGFQVIRKKGSHIVVQKNTGAGTITTVVPNHRELAPGTLRSILKKTGISIDELIRLLSVVLGVAVHFWPH
jgi:predicted RNA binding protein YcfA (HicA-like mRNA interferase family)